MSGLTIMMVLAAAGLAFWNASRAAAERATALGRDACRRAGVQLLDDSVHADRVRVRRRPDGRLGLEYGFRFHWSDDGVSRHVGRMVLLGDRLVSFSGPVPQAQNAS
ncbi:MAG: DUF3301 domain-containing protein [Gammaproteobacteria bacterium]|nr:DUF3301 domain-containing protein [Gammaproteobacteria bacterium]